MIMELNELEPLIGYELADDVVYFKMSIRIWVSWTNKINKSNTYDILDYALLSKDNGYHA